MFLPRLRAVAGRRSPTSRFRALFLLTFGLWAAVPEVLAAQTGTRLPERQILGGADFWAAMFDGVDSDPERVLASLNRVLLHVIQADHEWKQVERRALAATANERLTLLDRKFGREIAVPGGKAGQQRFEQIASELGYRARFRRGDLELTPKEGADQEAARRVANALGWDLYALGQSVAEKAQTLILPVETVTVPLSEAEWRTATGSAIPADPVEALIRDQRLGLVVAASGRLSRATRAAMADVGWDRLYRRAAPFYRYATAIRFRDGRQVLPGSSSTAWSGVLASDPRQESQFIRDLLDNRGARGAYLLHSLSFVPDRRADFYLGSGSSATGGEQGFARDVFLRVDNAVQGGLDAARGGDLEFGTLVRSLELDPEGGGLRLPGGVGLWYAAARWADAPTDRAALATAVRRATRRPMSASDFVLRLITEKNKVRGIDRSAMPRVLRAANLFGERPAILTPENVILLARATDMMPSSLDLLDALRVDDPETVTDLMLAAAHLEALAHDRDKELLLTNYQGGLEWLLSMSLADQVPAELLERMAGDWARRHQRVSTPDQAAWAQLEWIAELVASLPEASEPGRGRGPFEARMIEAMVPFPEESVFEFQGLDYRVERHRQYADSFADILAQQKLPAVDHLLQIRQAFDRAAEAASGQDLEGTRTALGALAALVKRLPRADVEQGTDPDRFWPRVLTGDREALLKQIERASDVKRVNRLGDVLEDLQSAKRLLAREIRPFLLGPGYLRAVGDDAAVLQLDENIVRKHVIYDYVDRFVPSDSGWLDAKAERGETVDTGLYFAGSVGRVARAMAEFRMEFSGDRLFRQRIWFQDALATRWSDIRPDATAALHAIRRLGDAVVAAAGDDDAAAIDFIARRVPRWRQEIGSGSGGLLISPSERVSIGLALLQDDGFGGREPTTDEVGTARTEASELFERLGDDPMAQLHPLGASTPNLNGRSRRWVGTWTPYEMVEHELLVDSLSERLMIDLRMLVLDYLGASGLPSSLGADLLLALLEDAGRAPGQSLRDWTSILRWMDERPDDYFDQHIRAFMNRGYYRALGL